MCRLFGFRSIVPSRAHHSLVHARDALVQQARHHPDGWGIGFIHGDDAYVVKTANAAVDCERFRRVTEGIRSHTLIAHLRKATVGELDHLNAHPFRHGRWIFAHNGSIWGLERGLGRWLERRTDPVLRALVMGDTDSERLFFFLLTRLGEQGVDVTGRSAPDADVVARSVRQALLELDMAAVERGLDRPLLNVLLTDGRAFVAHRAGMPLHLSTQKRHCAEAETCAALKVCLEARRPAGPVNHLLVASEPTATDENLWEEIPDGTTLWLDQAMHLGRVVPPTGWVAPVLPPGFVHEVRRAG